jgi:hypothetical protein
MRMKVIDVQCRCGKLLFQYQKVGAGKLIKCYLSRILGDYVGVLPHIEIGAPVICPRCTGRIGTIYGIRGVRAIKLNQGQIRPFRLD